MEDLETSRVVSAIDNRSGASASDKTSGLHPSLLPQQSEAPGDMPMIVWLRGDEPFLDEFSLDAEAAMQALGIKRSRLTQISGRELRVGRLRVDRYTRPVYRLQDIEAYKSWTRATASHIRASNVIQEAATKLEEQSHQLSDLLQQVIAQYTEKIEAHIDVFREEVRDHSRAHIAEAKMHSEEIRVQFTEHVVRTHNELRLRCDDLSLGLEKLRSEILVVRQQGTQIEKVAASQGILTDSLQALAQAFQEFADESKNTAQAQSLLGRDIGKALSLIIQFLRDGARKHDEAMELTRDLHQKVEHTAEAVKRRPTRRIPFAYRRRIARRMA